MHSGIGRSSISLEQLQHFASLRVAFGHQSVGADIVDGVDSLAKNGRVSVRISESSSPHTSPGLHHFRVGTNGRPLTKLREFEDVLRQGVAESADVAAVKLCYIDFSADLDPKELAREYIGMVDSLARDYPSLTLVPLTTPLTTIQSGPKAWIKRMVGRNPAGELENLRRAEFNSEIRRRYRGDARLFDLAAFESGLADGAAATSRRSVEALDPTLTYDGGHLNDLGRRRIGSAFIAHISQFPRRQD